MDASLSKASINQVERAIITVHQHLRLYHGAYSWNCRVEVNDLQSKTQHWSDGASYIHTAQEHALCVVKLCSRDRDLLLEVRIDQHPWSGPCDFEVTFPAPSGYGCEKGFGLEVVLGNSATRSRGATERSVVCLQCSNCNAEPNRTVHDWAHCQQRMQRTNTAAVYSTSMSGLSKGSAQVKFARINYDDFCRAAERLGAGDTARSATHDHNTRLAHCCDSLRTDSGR